jgi:uncharacterized repeat protein (TIGR01451 family)
VHASRTRRLIAVLPVIAVGCWLLAPAAAAAPPQPSISSFAPSSGIVGTSVQITGTDLQGTKKVLFNGTAATFVSRSHTLVTATVPPGATSGPSRVVRANASATSADTFTVLPSDPDLTLHVNGSADPVIADSSLTYTLSVKNVGGAPADETSLVDALPDGVMFKSASDAGTYDAAANAVRWNLGAVTPGARITESLTIEPIHPAYPMTNEASATTSSPDAGSPNTVTTQTEVDPQPGTHYVSVRDSGETPFYRGLALGETLQWDFFGPSDHEITDAHGLGFLDTGLQPAISYSRFTFQLSAEIRTKDLDAFPLNTGKITVPPEVEPQDGTTATSFLVVWALAQPPAGIVEDVQIKRPGGSWVRWQHRQTTQLEGTFVPDAGAGTYAFRSRIRNVNNGAVSRFGPPVPITVS